MSSNDKPRGVIHIAPDIGYLFPETAATAKTLCGRLVCEVLEGGEWVGVRQNLSSECEVCERCKEEAERTMEAVG